MRAVFLDRDGTLIEDAHYPKDPEKVVLLPGVIEGLKIIQSKGYSTFVVSNQSGVARGRIQEHEFLQVHLKVYELLAKEGVYLDQFFYCLHHPEDACLCRKPGIGLLPKTFRGQVVQWMESYFVGDKECDVEVARRMGGTAVLVLTGYGAQTWETLSPEKRMGLQCYSNLLEFSTGLPDRRDLQRSRPLSP